MAPTIAPATVPCAGEPSKVPTFKPILAPTCPPVQAPKISALATYRNLRMSLLLRVCGLLFSSSLLKLESSCNALEFSITTLF